MPGRPLLTLYDPAALRITASVPQAVALGFGSAQGTTPLAELPGVAATRIAPLRWQVLPAMDATTHTVQLRLDLPPGTAAAPGQFARAWLSDSSTETPRLSVPERTVVRHAELTAVYVLADDTRPLLRQVRLGPPSGDRVEVLSGLRAGERVALDPQAAARVR
jgi:multidrug efflux pump subunit AcrA (membrane-fusion protein)